MSIPGFNTNSTLPPFRGSNPTIEGSLSPYECTIVEFCYQFSNTLERLKILIKFLEFRKKIYDNGITVGFQLLNGSMCQNIEASEKRPPRDIDVVTCFFGLESLDLVAVKMNFPEFSDPILSKQNYLVDHYTMQIDYDPFVTYYWTNYFIQLFTHTRDNKWKGILRVPLYIENEDKVAREFLLKKEF